MNATHFAWLAVLMFVVLFTTIARFANDQRIYRRCKCGFYRFYDWPEGRFCKRCLAKWRAV